VSAKNNKKLENLIHETTNRLRLIQVDFADESDQTRAEYLCEEVERALKMVLPDERNEFLERLMARFPTLNVITQPTLEERGAKGSSTMEVGKLRDPDFLIRSLLEIAPTLSNDQKKNVIKSLRERELEPQIRQDYSDESIQKLKAKLQLDDMPGIDTNRLTELIILLIDFIYKLEPLVWNTWRKLSPRSNISPRGNMKNTIGQFMHNDSQESREHVDSDLKELQRLVAAITTAVGRVGGQFAKSHLAKFSPSEISALVRMEHKSVLVSHEVKCWRKYVELADTLTEDTIETEIRKAIVDYVESLVKRTSR
jgi:hypothetical protein